MPDTYQNFAALSASEDRDAFSISVRDNGTPFAVAAPHGGGIEPGTSEIARAIAGEDLSYYLFEGLMAGKNSRLHITSTNFDEPRCLKLLRTVDRVITVHGEGGNDAAVYLGGRHMDLIHSLRTRLFQSGFAIGDHSNADLRGISFRNICNIGRLGAGVQLELSKGLRRSFFASFNQKGRNQPTNRLTCFAGCVREALKDHGLLASI